MLDALACLNSPLTMRLVTSAGTSTDVVVEPNVFRTRFTHVSTIRPRDIRSSATAALDEAEYRAINNGLGFPRHVPRDDEPGIVVQHRRKSSSPSRFPVFAAIIARTLAHSASSSRYLASLCVLVLYFSDEIFHSLVVRRKRARTSDLISRSHATNIERLRFGSRYVSLSLPPLLLSVSLPPSIAHYSFWHEVSSSDVCPETRLRESRSKAASRCSKIPFVDSLSLVSIAWHFRKCLVPPLPSFLP